MDTPIKQTPLSKVQLSKQHIYNTYKQQYIEQLSKVLAILS